MSTLPLTRIVLYKHGVGHFEREGAVEGDAALSLTFKQAEVSDVLKSLTVLDLDGGHIASVSYDSTKPLEQLLAEVALNIPDQGSLVGLLPQIKGARVALSRPSTGAMGIRQPDDNRIEGILLGVDSAERRSADGVVKLVLVSLLTDAGELRQFDLHSLGSLEVLDPALRRDLEYYLKTQLSAKKKDARTFTFFAQGQGRRTVRLSYTVGAPVWKATYRILIGEEGKPPMIQGWAVVDNTQDEDWNDVQLSLIAGLPVAFEHDLYTPRYIRRPVVEVQETTGVLPPTVEEGMEYFMESMEGPAAEMDAPKVASMRAELSRMRKAAPGRGAAKVMAAAVSSTPAQVRERKIGDLFEYEIEHPVTIKRNQSALVPIVLRSFEGRPVLLYNKANRPENPMRCVEFKNTTGLTLEGGPVTVLEADSYVGEAMLDTLKPDEQRLVPFAVELSVHVLDNIDSREDRVHRVVIRNGVLKAHSLQVRETTYSCNNKSGDEHTVYLEHPRESGQWKLYETPEPVEVTESYWRFRFALAASKVTQFVVKQKHTVSRQFGLADLDADQLAYWHDHRYLDAATEKVLKEIVALREQAGELMAEVEQLQKESDSIHKEQERIRGNLKALGDRSAEKELRDRLVRTLNGQEDRLEQINREFKEKTAAAGKIRQKINALLAKLEYVADL